MGVSWTGGYGIYVYTMELAISEGLLNPMRAKLSIEVLRDDLMEYQMVKSLHMVK